LAITCLCMPTHTCAEQTRQQCLEQKRLREHALGCRDMCVRAFPQVMQALGAMDKHTDVTDSCMYVYVCVCVCVPSLLTQQWKSPHFKAGPACMQHHLGH
jgi:hypothetical protein